MTASMNRDDLRAIARAFGAEPEVQVLEEENGIVIQTDVWDWALEPVSPRAPLTDAFRGTLYRAIPEVVIDGGGGLRSRWFALAEGRVFTLDDPDDMRWFLARYVSRDDPAALASFVERCVGDGRVANVYRDDGTLERTLREDGRHAIVDLGLAEPILKGDELRFWSWRVVMDEGGEAIQLERWTVSLDSPRGAEWYAERLPGVLRRG